jgi:hypothetical protein
MSTTAVLPAFTLGETEVPAGLRLPAFTLGETDIPTGLRLPTFTLGEIGVPAGLRLPGFALSSVLDFSLTATGGMTLGGGADIFGDPIIPTGGMTVGGEAAVSDVSVMIFDLGPLGGVRVGGAAGVSDTWAVFVPSGGVRVGGAAAVPNAFAETATGGMVLGGAAFDGSPFVATGGMVLGGSAGISLPSINTIIPAGGVTIGGVAPVSTLYPETVGGGMRVGGTAPVTGYFPVHVPSGGMRMGGAAQMYMLPGGFTPTPSNPFNDDFTAWAINYDTSAPSRFVGLPATSMCRFKGVTYMTTRAGVYRYAGATDDGAPIPAAVTTPRTDYKNPYDKRIPAVYVAARADGDLALKVIANDTVTRYYALEHHPSYVHGSRATLGRGLQARYWQFRVENRAGATFDLDSIEFKPQILKRHGV